MTSVAATPPGSGDPPATASRLPILLNVRMPHLVQISIQFFVFLYWQLYFPEARTHLVMLLELTIFGFAVDAAVSFGRYRSWMVTFGPIPVVLSANLFVWFRGPQAWVSYVIVALGIASKHLIQRGGRHVFNPSAFGVSVVALPCLLFPHLFGEYDLAHPLNLAPNMVEVILVLALIAQIKVPVVLISIGAALVTLLPTGLLASFFARPYMPELLFAPILLGVTLLVTDPATTPRTQPGKLLFGAAYMVAFALIGTLLNLTPVNNFWAKMLPIPVLNWLAPRFDALVARRPRLSHPWLDVRYNRRHVAAWAAAVAAVVALSPVKAKLFERELHGVHHTRFVAVDGLARATCEDNQVFCRPFSFARELHLWLGDRDGSGATAHRP